MPLAIVEVRGEVDVNLGLPSSIDIRTTCIVAAVMGAHLGVCALLLMQLAAASPPHEIGRSSEGGGIELSLVGLAQKPGGSSASASTSAAASVRPSLEALLGVRSSPNIPVPTVRRSTSNVFAELDAGAGRPAAATRANGAPVANSDSASLGPPDPFAHPSLFAKASADAAGVGAPCRAPPGLREPISVVISLTSEGAIAALRRADGSPLADRRDGLSETEITQALADCRSLWAQVGTTRTRSVVLQPRPAL